MVCFPRMHIQSWLSQSTALPSRLSNFILRPQWAYWRLKFSRLSFHKIFVLWNEIVISGSKRIRKVGIWWPTRWELSPLALAPNSDT